MESVDLLEVLNDIKCVCVCVSRLTHTGPALYHRVTLSQKFYLSFTLSGGNMSPLLKIKKKE